MHARWSAKTRSSGNVDLCELPGSCKPEHGAVDAAGVCTVCNAKIGSALWEFWTRVHITTYCVPVHKSPRQILKLIQQQFFLLLWPVLFWARLDIVMNLSIVLHRMFCLCRTHMWVCLALDDQSDQARCVSWSSNSKPQWLSWGRMPAHLFFFPHQWPEWIFFNWTPIFIFCKLNFNILV